GELLAEPLPRAHPGVRPRNPLRAVLVAGQLPELAKLGDGAGRIERHRRRAYRSSSSRARRTPAGATPTTSTSVRPSSVAFAFTNTCAPRTLCMSAKRPNGKKKIATRIVQTGRRYRVKTSWFSAGRFIEYPEPSRCGPIVRIASAITTAGCSGEEIRTLKGRWPKSGRRRRGPGPGTL